MRNTDCVCKTRLDPWARPHRIGRWIGRVVILCIFVRNPFTDVAIHVIQPPRIGFLFANRMRVAIPVVLEPCMLPQDRGIIAKEPFCASSASPAGIFPFRFSGESRIFSCCFGKQASKGDGAFLTNVVHGAVRRLGRFARICVCHALVLGLCGWVLAEVTLLIRPRHTSATLCGGCVVGCGQSVVASHTLPAPWLKGPATKLCTTI